MMKKLLIFMLVLGLANVASAVIHYELGATDLGGGDYSIDIIPTDPGGVATHLIFSGDLLVSITGDAAIIDVSALTYSDNTTDFWHPDFGLLHQEIVAADGKSGQFGANSVSTMDLFWLVIPNIVQGNIIVTLNSGIATITVTPNNQPNAFGNTMYYDGTLAVTDYQATGGSVDIPEPMTIALFGLGGLFLLRRRQN
ncbi:MAG: PEP-CTERM sorting domain-containing protein [Planctomycetota bacterium]|jgi:hypothetical protein